MYRMDADGNQVGDPIKLEMRSGTPVITESQMPLQAEPRRFYFVSPPVDALAATSDSA